MQLTRNSIHIAIGEGHLDLVKYLAPLAADHICDEDITSKNYLDWANDLKQQSIALYLCSNFPALMRKVRLMLLMALFKSVMQ